MAYRNIKFGGDFEAWLDNKLSKIRTEASDTLQRVRGLVNPEDSKLRSASVNSDSYGAIDDLQYFPTECEQEDTDLGTNGDVEFGELVGQDTYHGPDQLASSIRKYELVEESKYEVEEEEDWSWDDFTTQRMSRSKQNGQAGGDGGFGGGAFYTTVFMDDDAMPAEDYPQTPSARDRVARILSETELKEVKGESRMVHQYDFDYEDTPQDTREGSDDYAGFDDNWSLEDEPAVTLDPARLAYRYRREAGDGEDTPQKGGRIYRGVRGGAARGEGLLAERDVEGAVEVEEYTDAVEDLHPQQQQQQQPTGEEEEDIDIKTPTGKGRALLPMLEDLELSFEEDNSESDDNILVDMEDIATISMRPMSDTAPIIMDEAELQQRMLKRRRRIKIGVITFSAVMAVTAFALVTYLTVHMLTT